MPPQPSGKCNGTRGKIYLILLVLNTGGFHHGSVGAQPRGVGSVSEKPTRRYDSTLRRRQAEQNRRAILDAAVTLIGSRLRWAAIDPNLVPCDDVVLPKDPLDRRPTH